MAQTIYRKVTIALYDDEGKVTIQCIHLKSDDKLTVGEEVTVRGELKRHNSLLEFGNGCTCIKAAEDNPPVDQETVARLRSLQEGEAFASGFCAMTGKVDTITLVPNDKPQKITYYIGALTMFVAAVFYLLMADLSFKNTSDRLIVAVLLAFGSAIMFFVSANFVDRPVLKFLFKGIGLALAVGFVLYMHLFSQSEYYLGELETLRKWGLSKAKELAMSQATIYVTLVLAYIATVAQAANTVIEAVVKEE